MTDSNMLPRGIRNNNPLNIRRTQKTTWRGQKSTQEDPYFVQFVNMKWGWRAAFRLLTRNYYHQHHLSTIRGIVSRWAPPQDHNSTEEYIDRVARLMRFDPDQTLGIPLAAPERWMQLAVAMAIVECGTEVLDYMAMLEGWRMNREDAGIRTPGEPGA